MKLFWMWSKDRWDESNDLRYQKQVKKKGVVVHKTRARFEENDAEGLNSTIFISIAGSWNTIVANPFLILLFCASYFAYILSVKWNETCFYN